VTKHPQQVDKSAAPQGDGAPEILPTDEMIAAGAYLIAEEWGVLDADVAPDVARGVFVAMWCARPR
jgi:hypothetical protein